MGVCFVNSRMFKVRHVLRDIIRFFEEWELLLLKSNGCEWLKELAIWQW